MVYILSDSEAIEIYNEYYAKGISTCQLFKMFGHTHHYYLDKFKALGLEIRSNSINSRKFTADFHYFDQINTPEKAYWLGFIYADGYISRCNGRNIVGIALAAKDRGHLEKFKRCVHATYPIHDYISNRGYKNGTKYSRILIESVDMVDALVSHGVYENKTNIIKRPNIDSLLIPSFILGYFDGDGSIFLNQGRSPFYSINIVGTDDMLYFIHQYLVDSKILNRDANIEKRKPEQTVSYIRYGGNRLVTCIMDVLYADVPDWLPLSRKKELYQKCKSRSF